VPRRGHGLGREEEPHGPTFSSALATAAGASTGECTLGPAAFAAAAHRAAASTQQHRVPRVLGLLHGPPHMHHAALAGQRDGRRPATGRLLRQPTAGPLLHPRDCAAAARRALPLLGKHARAMRRRPARARGGGRVRFWAVCAASALSSCACGILHLRSLEAVGHALQARGARAARAPWRFWWSARGAASARWTAPRWWRRCLGVGVPAGQIQSGHLEREAGAALVRRGTCASVGFSGVLCGLLPAYLCLLSNARAELVAQSRRLASADMTWSRLGLSWFEIAPASPKTPTHGTPLAYLEARRRPFTSRRKL
jgi:hypothetical protein